MSRLQAVRQSLIYSSITVMGRLELQVDSSMSKKFYLDPYTIYGWCMKKRLQNELNMIIITVLNTKTTHTHVHEKLD